MNSGSIAFIIMCAALVFLMTPALAFFYGGLERRKNVLNTMLMAVIPLGIASILWVAIGYTLSFSGDGSWIGNFGHAFFNGVSMSKNSLHGLEIPDGLFGGFQMMFSIITVALLTGSVVGRMRFTPLVIFMAFWLVLVYYPLAHMVWGGGFLAKIHSIDFAGGNVVHISSGVSALVLAIVLGRRRDYARLEYRPHNIPFVLLGAGLLWFGWFGFNAGSALAANGLAVSAFATTNTAAAAAGLSWMFFDVLKGKKPSVTGFCIGAVVGLVAITPAAGFVAIPQSIFIGVIAAVVSNVAVYIKSKSSLDDTLDVFPCHGIGGMVGMLMTGLFASKAINPAVNVDGWAYGNFSFFLTQLKAMGIAVTYSFVVSFAIFKFINFIVPIRVSNQEEEEGLDASQHNEKYVQGTIL